jgi:transcriptional regulator with XRE-family HTH domain
MTGHGAKFGRKQEEAIAALLTQRNMEEAARAVGVSPKTLLRWMKNPEFDVAYREARRAAFSQSIARLQQAAGAAATTFLKLMVDPGAPPAVRLRAADLVFTHGAKAIEIEDSSARVSELEKVVESQNGGANRQGSWRKLG